MCKDATGYALYRANAHFRLFWFLIEADCLLSETMSMTDSRGAGASYIQNMSKMSKGIKNKIE